MLLGRGFALQMRWCFLFSFLHHGSVYGFHLGERKDGNGDMDVDMDMDMDTVLGGMQFP